MSVRRVHDTYSVFVGQIGSDVTKNDLRELFQGCGDIAEMVILEDKNRIKKNYGFVRYFDAESAFRAASELNGWILKGSSILVDISKDTSEKVKREKGVALKKRALKPDIVKDVAPRPSNSLMKDTMYLNRLKDSLTSFSWQYAQDQVNYNRLLHDIGPISTFCPTMWASLKEHVSFEKVSAIIMEKCKENEASMSFGEQRVTEFNKSLQIIVSEISHVINVDRVLDPVEKQDPVEEEKPIFDDHTVPESVRRLQKLEKYNAKQTTVTVHSETDKGEPHGHSKVMDEIAMPELELLDIPVNVKPESETKGPSLTDTATLENHFSRLKETDVDLDNPNTKVEDFNEDILENLFLKMKVPRSSSRDSSLSDESIINDSGVECDSVGLGATSTTTQPEIYECYRAEGRQRPPDNRAKISQQKVLDIPDQQSKKQPFSLENYILKSVGRGRGLAASSIEQEPLITPVGRGRGVFSEFSGGN